MIKRTPSLLGYVTLTVLPLGLILLSSLWMIGNSNLTKTVETEIKRNVIKLGEQISVRIEERLDGLEKFTETVAMNSLVVNGLIDVDGRSSYLPAFFRSLESPSSSKVDFWMVDYKGREIARNHLELLVPSPEITDLESSTFMINEGEIIISQPIRYQGNVEGALIAQFPSEAFSELFDVTGPNFRLGIRNSDEKLIYSSADDLRLALSSEPTEMGINWIINRIYLADRGLTLLVAQPRAEAFAALDTVKSAQLIALVSYQTLALFLVLLTAFILIRRLKRFSNEIANVSAIGHLDHRLSTDGPKEIRNLAQAFNSMFDRLAESAKATDQLNRELREAQKLEAIGQLAGGIAHEINTPSQYIGDNLRFISSAHEKILGILRVVASLAEKQLAEGELKSELEELEQEIENIDLEFLNEELPQATSEAIFGVEQISTIVLAMKEFSHPGTKEKTAVDVNRAIENTLTISRNNWKHVAQVKTEFDPKISSLFCLPGELNQVYLNLIVNASHAIEEAGIGPDVGMIEVKTMAHPKAVEITISDNGVGMSEEVRSRIFEPFYTTKEVGKGTGQGLAIAHDIITRKHGGRIAVTSEEGVGTTFSICLPFEEVSTLPNTGADAV